MAQSSKLLPHIVRIGILLFLFVVHSCQKDEIDPAENEAVFAIETGSSDMPYLVIETRGLGIINEPKIPAELILYIQKAEVQRTQIGIEFRGSTSYRCWWGA